MKSFEIFTFLSRDFVGKNPVIRNAGPGLGVYSLYLFEVVMFGTFIRINIKRSLPSLYTNLENMTISKI